MGSSKVSGCAGFAFLGSILLLNGMRLATGRPPGDAGMADIVAYFAEHGGIPRLASFIAPVPMVSLPVFAAGVLVLTRDTTLGSYSVTAKIGEGGMGEVYRARDAKLDRGAFPPACVAERGAPARHPSSLGGPVSYPCTAKSRD